jgi:sulfite exporter TauE/SafE
LQCAWRGEPVLPLSAVIGAWLAGTLGGVHCLAMCGGFMAAISARERAASGGAAPLLPARALVRRQLGYHAGRLATYALLGAAFGTAGSLVLQGIDILPIQRALYVIANVFLLVLGLSLATRSAGAGWLQRVGVRVFGVALPVLRPLLQHRGPAGRIALGLVWGLVPCALVYSVLPLALFAGGAWEGAAIMLAFGLGTWPNLAATGLLLGRTGSLFGRATARRAAAMLLTLFALAGIYRALYLPDAIAQGPFCLVP